MKLGGWSTKVQKTCKKKSIFSVEKIKQKDTILEAIPFFCAVLSFFKTVYFCSFKNIFYLVLALALVKCRMVIVVQCSVVQVNKV